MSERPDYDPARHGEPEDESGAVMGVLRPLAREVPPEVQARRTRIFEESLRRAPGTVGALKTAALEYAHNQIERRAWTDFHTERRLSHESMARDRRGAGEAAWSALRRMVDQIGISEESRIVVEQDDYRNETRVRLTTFYPPAVKEWHDKAQRVDQAEARVAALEAEVAHMREVMGWSSSPDNAPALGGEK